MSKNDSGRLSRYRVFEFADPSGKHLLAIAHVDRPIADPNGEDCHGVRSDYRPNTAQVP
jgi:hypothetical protein